MADRALKNVSHSVFARLKNLRTPDHDLYQLLQRFTAERFLYRLSVSPEAERFTLKGATLFLVWCGEALRSTRDVDLTRPAYTDRESLQQALGAICVEPCPEDGLVFDPEAIGVSELPIDPDEPGRAVRAKLKGTLGKVRLSLQVDVGFDDVIAPGRQRAALPTLLDHPAPRVWTNPRETAVAEKLHAMARWGVQYTRIKDIWDVAALAMRFPFDGGRLREAVDLTFQRRGTVPTHDLPAPLATFFYNGERGKLWSSFQRSSTILVFEPATLSEAGRIVREFLEPVWRSAAQGEPFELVWPPGGPWRDADGADGTQDD